MVGFVSSLESYLERANNELLNSSLLTQRNNYPISNLLPQEKKTYISIDLPIKVGEILGIFLSLYGNSIRSFLGGKSLVYWETPLFIVRYSGDSVHVLFGVTVHQEDLMAFFILATLCLFLVAGWKLAALLLSDSSEKIIHMYSQLSPHELSVSEDSSEYKSLEESDYIPLIIGICNASSNFPSLDLKNQGISSLYEDLDAKDNKSSYDSPLSSDATMVAAKPAQNNLLKARPLFNRKGGHLFFVSAEYLLLLMPSVDSWLDQLPICSSASEILDSLVDLSKTIKGESPVKFSSDQILLLRFFVSTDYMGFNDQIKNQVSFTALQISNDPSIIISALESRDISNDCKVELMLLVSALAVFDVTESVCTSLMVAILMALLKMSKCKGSISTFAGDSFCVMIASSSDILLLDLFNHILESPDDTGIHLIMLIRALAFYIVVNEETIVHQFLEEPTSNKLQNRVVQLILKSHKLYGKFPNHSQECQHSGTTFTLLDEMTTLYNVVQEMFSENPEIPSPIQLELIDSVVSKIYCTLKEESVAAEIRAPSIEGLGAN